jgi:hypothetical protein
VRISSIALARGYALLALSSRDRAFSRCWAVPHHPDMPSNDVHSVSGRAQHWMREWDKSAHGALHRLGWGAKCAWALHWLTPDAFTCCHAPWMQVSAVLAVLLPREGLQGLPLYALGASSGGAFVLALPAYLPLKGERCTAQQFGFGTTCTQHVFRVGQARI